MSLLLQKIIAVGEITNNAVVVGGGTMLLLHDNLCEWSAANGAPIVLEYDGTVFHFFS